MTTTNKDMVKAAPQGAAAKVKATDTTIDQVLSRINTFKATGDLKLPPDYSPENAVRAAWLLLQEQKDKTGKSVLEACTKESICNALLKMVVLGLSVIKKQCDFIAYGDKLSCDMEYAGNIALAKRYGRMKWIKANAIFEGDDFEFEVNPETGRKKVLKHVQKLENLGETTLRGAYAVYELEGGIVDTEIMNIKQIQHAWNQGGAKGQSPAHRNFPDQMAIKTAINRACKLLIRSSDDSVLMTDEDDNKPDRITANVKHEISQNANKQQIGFGNGEAENGNGHQAEAEEENVMVDEPAGQEEMGSENIQSTQSTIGGPGF